MSLLSNFQKPAERGGYLRVMLAAAAGNGKVRPEWAAWQREVGK